MEEQKFRYVRADEFFKGSRKTTIQEDVMQQTRQENNHPTTTSQAYRSAGIDGEAWSYLGNKVMGAES